MTRVELSPEAAAYVRERGGALTLRMTPRHGCCGGSVGLPVAEATAPRDPAGFDRVPVDAPGVALYVEAGLGEAGLGEVGLGEGSGGPLRVGLDRLLGFRSLYVEGAAARVSPRPASSPSHPSPDDL